MENNLKYDLIQQIVKTEDDTVLEQIRLLLESINNDWYFSISEEERNSILRGKEDLAKGNKLSHSEVMAEAKSKFLK
ncbi:MAG: hypothetical protein H7329_09165 [Opitutaceae bacterium]|nr:hypothetical protein [Cytophagales bacterium]